MADPLGPTPEDAGPPEELDSDLILDDLLATEMGDQIAAVFRRIRRDEESRYREAHPEEGLRERKRRLTRKLISDAATMLFATRGFDEVKVAEIARRVGVSEKTIYNYFPTKEAMVLDTTDEMVESLVTTLRDRAPGRSITEAVVDALEIDTARFDVVDDEAARFVSLFVAMIEDTPSLHAAWLEVHDRLAHVAAEELARQAGIDPRDPEPIVAGRALVGLFDVGMQSRVRHTEEGLRGPALGRAVAHDVRRAARLLDTGLWSFQLPRTERARNQALEAARAAEEARRQVLVALAEARAAWEQARNAARDAGVDARRAGQAAHDAAQAAARDAKRRARDEARARDPRRR